MNTTLSFLRALLAAPAEVGALWPSSRHLAQSMAQAAAACGASGRVIEVGAGSGALTRALLNRFGSERLQVVECAPELVQVLRKKFPHLDIRRERIEHFLPQAAPDPGSSLLVSSLPFKSLPAAQARLLSSTYIRFVQNGGAVIQFSYGLAPPFVLHDTDDLQWQRVSRVWRNLPPACIWRLQAKKKDALSPA